MLYPSESEWAEWGVDNEYHQFFCLHWVEMFDPETPDTWQVRSCNVKTLLAELIEASRVAEDFDAYRGVMRSILDETFAVVKRDAILEGFYPFVSAYLEPWRGKEVGEKAVQDVARLGIVILGNLESYWENGVRLVTDLLTRAEGKRKKELYGAAMNLAVETVARGWSPSHIKEAFLTGVLTCSPKPLLDRVGAFFDGLAAGERQFRCVFLTEGIRRKDAAWLPPDIKLEGGRPNGCSGAAEKFYSHAPNDGISLAVGVKATDAEAARRLAEKRVGELFAGTNLFSIDSHFGVKVASALVQDEAGAANIIGHRRLGSHYLGSYDSRQVKLDQLFRVQQRLQTVSPSDAAQLAAALEYHRLALQATSDEARLVSGWGSRPSARAGTAVSSSGSGRGWRRACR